MFENFSVSANEVMQLAEKEARAFNHEYVGTEHILLGLVKEAGRRKRGLAHEILSRSGIKKIKARIEKMVRLGPELVPDVGKLSITPRGKKVIEYAIKQALSSNRKKVTMEDLLVGLLYEREGIACMALEDCGVEREQILRTLGVTPKKARSKKETVSAPSSAPSLTDLEEELRRVRKIGAKGRPVKCKFFETKEFVNIKAGKVIETAHYDVSKAITEFLSDGKELVQADQSPVLIPRGSAEPPLLITKFTIFYRDKK